MAIVTDLSPQVKDKRRVNVYLDGRFFCGMDAMTVFLNRLKVGMEISEEEIERIATEAELSAAVEKGARFLAASAKTEKEVYDHLLQKGYPPKVSALAVEKLKGAGFLCDADYAAEYVESAIKKSGIKMIRLKLKQKGVSEKAIEAALSDVSEASGADAVLQKYLRGKPASPETYQKAYRHLLSKGFSYEAAAEALARQKSAREDDEV